VSVVFPASGWEMMAKVRRREISLSRDAATAVAVGVGVIDSDDKSRLQVQGINTADVFFYEAGTSLVIVNS
jgi:hypothetical protein